MEQHDRSRTADADRHGRRSGKSFGPNVNEQNIPYTSVTTPDDGTQTARAASSDPQHMESPAGGYRASIHAQHTTPKPDTTQDDNDYEYVASYEPYVSGEDAERDERRLSQVYHEIMTLLRKEVGTIEKRMQKRTPDMERSNAKQMYKDTDNQMRPSRMLVERTHTAESMTPLSGMDMPPAETAAPRATRIPDSAKGTTPELHDKGKGEQGEEAAPNGDSPASQMEVSPPLLFRRAEPEDVTTPHAAPGTTESQPHPAQRDMHWRTQECQHVPDVKVDRIIIETFE